MARDKEKSVNPATAHLKAQKARQLKKGRAEALNRRNEKLARRNPDRLQRQIDDLKALESSGAIKPREKQILEELERDLRAVRKAKEALGDKTQSLGSGPRKPDRPSGELLGKRKWDGERKLQSPYRELSPSSGSETDESVRRIPMPRDTPPPIPRRHRPNAPYEPASDSQTRQPHALPPKPTSTPPVEVKSTYESAPQLRNLRKEAVSRFMPNVVRQNREAVKGQGKLVEPEEMDRLEQSGYLNQGTGSGTGPSNDRQAGGSTTTAHNAPTDLQARRLAAEEERFRREMEMDIGDANITEQELERLVEADSAPQQNTGGGRPGHPHQVEMEEVEDEDL